MLVQLIIRNAIVCLIFTAISEQGYFIVAAQYSIARVSLDGERSKILSINSSDALAIDYDFK